MPPLPPTPSGVVRVNLTFNSTTTFGSRFFMAYNGGPATNSDCATFATAVRTAFGAHLASLASTDLGLHHTLVTDLSVATPGYGNDSTEAPGTNASAFPSDQIATVIDFTIARKYRGGKPKIFLPLGTVADQADQVHWGSAFIGNVNTDWTAFINALTAFTSTTLNPTGQVNVSYYNGYDKNQRPAGNWRGPGYPYPPLKRTVPVVDAITGHSPRPIFGSQRRRLTAGG